MSTVLPEWPLFGVTDDVRPLLATAARTRTAAVLATLVRVDGGGPRPPGVQMAFVGDEVAGYFSGGCVEGDVALHAQACRVDGEPRFLVYGAGSPWPDIRLLCGARIEIFLEHIGPDDPVLGELLEAALLRKPVVWVSDGHERRLEPAVPEHTPDGVICRPYDPVPRLVVVGSDPIALAIADLGARTGYETTLVRPKGPAEPPPLAGVGYLRDEPAAALKRIGLDRWTAVAVATHDLDTDEAALHAALDSDAGYVGLLGARARLPERLARLKRGGVPDRALARLRAPIGLDIGGKAPWEVAISVMGEITALRYARSKTSTSTSSPSASAGAPGARRTSAPAEAKTVTSEES